MSDTVYTVTAIENPEASPKYKCSVYLSNFNRIDSLRRMHPSNIAKLTSVASGPKYYYDTDRDKFPEGTFMTSNVPPFRISQGKITPQVSSITCCVGGYVIVIEFNDLINPLVSAGTDDVDVVICTQVNDSTDPTDLSGVVLGYVSSSETEHTVEGFSNTSTSLILYSSNKKIYTPLTDFDSIDGVASYE